MTPMDNFDITIHVNLRALSEDDAYAKVSALLNLDGLDLSVTAEITSIENTDALDADRPRY